MFVAHSRYLVDLTFCLLSHRDSNIFSPLSINTNLVNMSHSGFDTNFLWQCDKRIKSCAVVHVVGCSCHWLFGLLRLALCLPADSRLDYGMSVACCKVEDIAHRQEQKAVSSQFPNFQPAGVRTRAVPLFHCFRVWFLLISRVFVPRNCWVFRDQGTVLSPERK